MTPVVNVWLANPSLSRAEACNLLGIPEALADDMVDVTSGDAYRVRADFPKIAGYLTGSSDIQWTAAEWQHFTGRRVRIDQAAAGWEDSLAILLAADVFDIEPGAEDIGRAVRGCQARAARGLDSCGYVTGSEWQPFVDAVRAAGLSIGRLVAVQWAWPTTNPRTLVPGMNATLSAVNADLSVTRHDWMPIVSPRPAPKPAPKPRRRHHLPIPHRHPKPPTPVPTPPPSRKPHPKVAAAFSVGALVTGIEALLHSVFGATLTPVEASALTVLAAGVAGYLKGSA